MLLLLACGQDVSVSKYRVAPEATITFPTDGAVLPEGSAISFRADVVDTDSAWEGLSYAWSTGDGSLLSGSAAPDESGCTYVSDPFENGEWTVTVTVIDDDGLSGDDSVSFSVAPGAAPEVAFGAPLTDDVFAEGQAIDVSIVVSDEDEADLNDIVLSWEGEGVESAPSAPASDGTAAFRLGEVAVGSQTLSVVATDSLGSTGRATVYYEVVPADADGDGHDDLAYGGDDCDDADAGVHPGADEVCDGEDQDCDGEIDEEAVDAPTWYADADADGWGDPASPVTSCVFSGEVDNADDCDDGDPAVNPAGIERCNGIDDDCDDEIDEDAADAPTWYTDADADGWGDPASPVTACEFAGEVDNAEDCDDGDGGIHPDAAEVCDGVDQDCDGDIDEDAGDAGLWYADADGDGYGDPALALAACAQPAGYDDDDDDCDDGDPEVHPGAAEPCDGVDNDCDGAVDEDSTEVGRDWYLDADGDGYGSPDGTVVACGEPEGYAATDDDCDDGDATAHPGADEYCDGADDDCDGDIDEAAVDTVEVWADADGDGWGDPAAATEVCELGAGQAANDEDCDDGDAEVHPLATEWCNEIDDDCDGSVDESSASDAESWYADDDADGYGDPSRSTVACDPPSGWTGNGEDCDDDDGAVNPGAAEVCDPADVDEDCDGLADDASAGGRTSYWRDDDGDGYGDATAEVEACEAPPGWVADDDDCDDTDWAVNPAATELCNDKDDDCDGLVDDDDPSVADRSTWYADDDGDGYGGSSSLRRCALPEGYTATTGDCDDDDAAVSPLGVEDCATAADDDCDGDGNDENALGCVDLHVDADGDGWGDDAASCLCVPDATYEAEVAGDCDDGDADSHPEATETCGDDIDQDCDGADTTCPIEGDIALDEASITYYGGTASLRAGERVGFAPDVDGDGLDDVWIASVSRGLSAGSFWLLSGAEPGLLPLTGAFATVEAENSYDYLGQAVSFGDLTGDGEPDLVLGLDGDDNAAAGAGAAYVFDAPVSGGSWSPASLAFHSLLGGASNDFLGAGVDAGADLDGDGQVDLAAGAYADDSGAFNGGAVYVLFGPIGSGSTGASAADLSILGAGNSDYFGSALTHADLDGDGRAELFVAAYAQDSGGSSAGAVYGFADGAAGSMSADDYDWRFVGDAANQYYGYGYKSGANALDGCADVTGDGLEDLVVGSETDDGGGTDAGAVVVIPGSSSRRSGTSWTLGTTGAEFVGIDANDYLGHGDGGDLDGDGEGDVLLGASGADDAGTDAGAAYLFYGPISISSYDASAADATLYGPSSGDEAGVGVAIGSDVNGDGFGDLLVGGEGDDTGASAGGAAWLFYGTTR